MHPNTMFIMTKLGIYREKNSGRNVVLQGGTNLEFFEMWMWMQGTLKEDN
jgi:hypothetical protein